jgi:hypothetical protein
MLLKLESVSIQHVQSVIADVVSNNAVTNPAVAGGPGMAVAAASWHLDEAANTNREGSQSCAHCCTARSSDWSEHGDC